MCYRSASLTVGRSAEIPLKLEEMAEKFVLVGIVPETIVIGPHDQVVWVCDAGNLKIEFDPNRCPFLSNVFQAPSGVRLQSGASRAGTKPGAYKYSLFLNEMRVGTGEVLLREN
jgi:hypothetical protein